MPSLSTRPSVKDDIAALLADARERTLLLVSPLGDEDLHRQHDPLMSPIIWDLGHIAHFEELWLTKNLAGRIEFSEMPGLYNPFEHPRSTRAALPLPTLRELTLRMEEIRARVLDRLSRVELDDDNPLLRNGYVYHMVLQHEYQHNETILQTLQLKLGAPYSPPRPAATRAAAASHGVSDAEPVREGMLAFPGGKVEIGTTDRSWAYDNERPLHALDLPPFRIDRFPVSNARYLEFIRDGGYKDPRHWSAAGVDWLAKSNADAPLYWRRDGDDWLVRTMHGERPVAADHPVCHVCYYEAEAFAAWSGMRLPSELEWETAASWSGDGEHRDYPWGHAVPTTEDANVDQLSFGTAPLGAFPRNVSPLGCRGLIGDVWEWTSSDFRGYPGFEPFPYREYSEEFFGSEYRVLRGGSWATRSRAVRNSFRNWDYPIRRQIFSGFRCAADS